MGDTSVVSRVGSIRERSRGVGAHQESILVDDRRGEDAGLGVGEEIERLAVARASSEEIKRVAIEQGMKTLREDGLVKVLKGHTTIEEVSRVVV